MPSSITLIAGHGLNKISSLLALDKMKIAIIDITGRNPTQYNPSLCHAISKQVSEVKVTLCSPTLTGAADGYDWLKLLSLLPPKMAFSSETGLSNIILRGIESILNYVYISIWALSRKPDIIHFQWLPFVEYSRMDRLFLGLLHALSPQSKVFLTVHNVYPHRLQDNQKANYRKRFDMLKKYIAGYLVHLESSKHEFAKEFGINENMITVAYHGIYNHNKTAISKRLIDDGFIHVIMYGIQSRYKGADILMKALGLLPIQYQEIIRCSIIGRTDPLLFEECHEDAERLNVDWENQFVSDDYLFDAIEKSDLILLPYRAISQSGVLLLALSYKKPILTSNLPSFKETLDGYPDSYFFESNNPQSLANKLVEFVDGKIDKVRMCKVIERLNDKYSWDETAKRTLEAYGVLAVFE